MGVRRTLGGLPAAIPVLAATALLGGLLAAPAAATVGTATVTPTPTPTAVTAPALRTVYVNVALTPRNGATVGVASPIVAKFSAPVSYRGRAESHMRVYVGAKLATGAWYWKDKQTAIYRLKGFWPGHSRVYVRMALGGVELSVTKTTRFVAKSTSTRTHVLRIARSFVAHVDATTHRMRVVVDGKTVRVFKVSLGKADFETRSGIKSVIEKFKTRHMTSQGAGITDPNDQYDLWAPWAVRITPTGEFVHGAPWAAGRIGVRNGSHGCTNLFTADAKWFYDRSLVGDPVVTTGTPRRMEPFNGPGAVYNIPWASWLAKSALKGRWPA